MKAITLVALFALGIPTIAPPLTSQTAPTQAAKPADDDALDKLFAHATALWNDAYIGARFLDEIRFQRPNAYLDGAPSWFFDYQRDIDKTIDDLSAATSRDTDREKIRKSFLAIFRDYQEGYASFAYSLKLAQKLGGWTRASRTLYKRGGASVIHGETVPLLQPLRKLEKSQAFMDALPHELSEMRQPDFPQIRLGCLVWTTNPRTMVIVPANSLAYKLGFRRADYLVAVESKPAVGISTLKHAMAANRGKRILVEVERDDKKVTLEVEVPEDLSKAELQ